MVKKSTPLRCNIKDEDGVCNAVLRGILVSNRLRNESVRAVICPNHGIEITPIKCELVDKGGTCQKEGIAMTIMDTETGEKTIAVVCPHHGVAL